MASYDILGNIAIIKAEGKTKKQKVVEAKKLLERPSIKTVLEKASDGFELVVYKSPFDKFREMQNHLIIGLLFAIVFGYGYDKIKRRKH